MKCHLFVVLLLGVVTLSVLSSCAPTSEKNENSIGEMMVEYVEKLQELRSEVELLRELLVEELKEAQVSANISCINYPYQPSTADLSRLKDDVSTLKRLVPLARGIARYEEDIGNGTAFFHLLVNQTVDSLEDVIDEFDDINKAASPDSGGSTSGTEEPTEDDSNGRCNQVNSLFDEYQAVVQLYIALTYTEYDAVELSNYYNTPA